MSINQLPTLLRGLSLRVLDMLGPQVLGHVEQIRVWDNLPAHELAGLQLQRLAAVLRHARCHVAYYRTNGPVRAKNPDTLTLNQLRQFPIVSKESVRRHFDQLLSNDAHGRKWVVRKTGGSTGEPGLFAQDTNYDRWNVANKIYLKRVAGKRLGERELRLWGSPSDIIEGKERPRIRLRNWVYNRVELNSLRMTAADMHRYAETWKRLKPVWVEGYAQSLTEFAEFLVSKGISLPQPRGIVSSASPLFPEMEDTVYQAFSCPIYNRYGSREVGDLACNRPGATELKLAPWNHYVELLDDRGEPVAMGEEGRVVVTTLNNFVMPLIRYDIGDRAVAGTDRFHLQGVSGRVSAIFTNRSGDKVDAAYLRRQMFRAEWVLQYQIIQKDYDQLLYRVVSGDPTRPNQQDKLNVQDRVTAALGNSCRVEWEVVDRIEPSASGKFFETWSEIT